jgi:hypothetical protein
VVGKSSVNEGFLMGKSSRNGRSSIAMFDYRSVNPSDLKNTKNPSVCGCGKAQIPTENKKNTFWGNQSISSFKRQRLIVLPVNQVNIINISISFMLEIDNVKYTIWLFNIAMENCPFIDGLPIKYGDFPWLC